MKLCDILEESSLQMDVREVYNNYNQIKKHVSEEDRLEKAKIAFQLDYALEHNEHDHALRLLSKLELIVDRYQGIGECEEIWVDEAGEVLTEAARRAFKRIGKEIKRRYRCTTGPKKGKIVANPIVCATRKDPRKVRHGRKVARTKKGVRLRKTKIMKRTAMSKLARRMNQRLAGTKKKTASKVKSSTKKPSQLKSMTKSSSTTTPVKTK